MYVFFSTVNDKNLQRIHWYRAANDSERDIFSELPSSSLVKKPVAFASSTFGMFFFSAMETEIMHSGFAILPAWVDASAFPKERLTQLETPSTFSTDCLFELFCYVHPTSLGDDTLRVETNRAVLNPVVNVGVVTVKMRDIDKGIAR